MSPGRLLARRMGRGARVKEDRDWRSERRDLQALDRGLQRRAGWRARSRFFDEDVEVYDPDLPDGGTYRGREAVGGSSTSSSSGIDEHARCASFELIPAGDRVVGADPHLLPGRGEGDAEVEIRDAHTHDLPRRQGRLLAPLPRPQRGAHRRRPRSLPQLSATQSPARRRHCRRQPRDCGAKFVAVRKGGGEGRRVARVHGGAGQARGAQARRVLGAAIVAAPACPPRRAQTRRLRDVEPARGPGPQAPDRHRLGRRAWPDRRRRLAKRLGSRRPGRPHPRCAAPSRGRWARGLAAPGLARRSARTGRRLAASDRAERVARLALPRTARDGLLRGRRRSGVGADETASSARPASPRRCCSRLSCAGCATRTSRSTRERARCWRR